MENACDNTLVCNDKDWLVIEKKITKEWLERHKIDSLGTLSLHLFVVYA